MKTKVAQFLTLLCAVVLAGCSTTKHTQSAGLKDDLMKFDFGYADAKSVAEGFTAVGIATAYTDDSRFGIVTGSASEGGVASATDAGTDYLEGVIQFDFNVQKGSFYTVEVTYQGVLRSGYVNGDLNGYQLGNHAEMATESYTIPATLDKIDLRIADAGSPARIAKVVVTRQEPRKKREKRVLHHIGDSTSANNGAWGYRLAREIGTNYPELAALCDFDNAGAGGRNLSTYYQQGRLYNVLCNIYPGDIVMLGNNGTNGMGNSFEEDLNYYLDAAEALGAKVMLNSYTPHGAVANHTAGYKAETHTFDSYRRDRYETVVRKVAEERKQNDSNYLGFVEIGMNADAIFNAYVNDYAANGYESAEAAAQAIINCFSDHNHYSKDPLAGTLMLNGYAKAAEPGIVAQLVAILSANK